jgi:protein-S-isoprenylcysteine O-methyltransferase
MITGVGVCSFLWITFFVFWMAAALFTKRSVERISLGRALHYGIPVVLGYYLMFSLHFNLLWLQHRLFRRTETLGLVAIFLTAGGMAVAFWARAYLGRNWSSAPTIKERHELIRGGPYRFVRHPIYTGLLLAMVGTFLANGRVRGALGVLLVWYAWTIKSRMEEEFMVRTFGAEYVDYRRTTGALIPQPRLRLPAGRRVES